MHKMCAEMISTALRSQAPPPSYQAASTLPPVITYIGSNKKMVVEPPVVEPTPEVFNHRVHHYEAADEADSSSYSSDSEYSVDYSYSAIYDDDGSGEYDDLTDDENVNEYRKKVFQMSDFATKNGSFDPSFSR